MESGQHTNCEDLQNNSAVSMVLTQLNRFEQIQIRLEELKCEKRMLLQEISETAAKLLEKLDLVGELKI